MAHFRDVDFPMKNGDDLSHQGYFCMFTRGLIVVDNDNDHNKLMVNKLMVSSGW